MAIKLKKKVVIAEENLVKTTARIPKDLKEKIDILIENSTIESYNALVTLLLEEAVKKNKDILETSNNTVKEVIEDDDDEVLKKLEEEEKISKLK